MDVAVAPPANLQPPRRVRRVRRGNQDALIAWLDEQERLIRMRGIPTEVVREFDPLHNLPEPQGDEVERGRRTILFRFTENLEGSIADRIQAKIVEHVRSRFMLKLSAQVELRHVEEANRKMDYYQRDNGSSPWFETLAAAEDWVRRQEELRLENRQTPDTKWTYVRTKKVYVKVILDRHPLFLGQGCLHDWLRNKRGVLSLDTYRDNRCLFRCIAVHWAAKVRDNMRKTRELENSFFAQRPGLRNRLTDKHLPLFERHFKQGIEAYTVQPNGDFVLTHFPVNYDQVGRPVLTMGLYAGHAFLIKNLGQVARSFTCADCQARFTTACSLMRHAKDRCSGEPRSTARTTASRCLLQPTRKPSTPRPVAASSLQNGSSGRRSSGASTSTTLAVAMGASGTFWAPGWMVITPRRRPSSSTTAASGTVASSATPKLEGEPCRS